MLGIDMAISSWSVAQTKARLSEIVARTRRGPQCITKRGKPVAVIVSAQEFENLRPDGAGPHPMRAFLVLSEQMRAGAGLGLELPPRRVRRKRQNPLG
jgi:prevent-host-death family protein